MTGIAGETIGLGFVLLSNRADPMPSTRIAALNLFEHLRRAGLEPVVCHEPTTPTECPALSLDPQELRRRGIQCVVFQKVHGPQALMLSRRLRDAGLATIYLVCDLVDAEMADATDATIVVTDLLRSLYPAALQPRVHVVHDGIERPDLQRTAVRPDRGSRARPLRGVLVSSARLRHLPQLGWPPDWLSVHVVGRYRQAETSGAPLGALRVLLDPPRPREGWMNRLAFALAPGIRRVAWGPESVYDELLRADIALIPSTIDNRMEPPLFPLPPWLTKSDNRLTLAMSAALPVVATPIPAYARLVESGRNGYLAQSRAEWLDALTRLRDPDHRHELGLAARATVMAPFSIEHQARRFIDVVRSVLPNPDRAPLCGARSLQP